MYLDIFRSFMDLLSLRLDSVDLSPGIVQGSKGGILKERGSCPDIATIQIHAATFVQFVGHHRLPKHISVENL